MFQPGMFNSEHTFANLDAESSKSIKVFPPTAHVSNHLKAGLVWRSTCRRGYIGTTPAEPALPIPGLPWSVPWEIVEGDGWDSPG